ncbi:MAG: murein biosynthesis integral membrane protein MurJ [Methylobacteriaceae bacterium]|nr:murein biosynthesis integral membrane protein MurJ [Methylobacteriaceae bacterium]
MLRHLVSVSLLTLLSRVTGFLRDIVLARVLGAGLIADAFVVAFRLPNHFRAIFGEGAFNAAFVPSYAQTLEQKGEGEARRFSGHVQALLILSQIALLIAAWIFTPELVRLLAPGFADEPEKFALTVTLTRITFPYLLCMTLVTLHSGALNAHRRFAAAAFAPVLLNLSMIGALAVAFLFPNAGYAAAFGVLLAGVLELLLLTAAARRAGALAPLIAPKLSAEVKHFFKVIVPAVIGSAGVQIAIFADTIIGSLLPTGGVSSIYYADRIYQLPVGVLGVAAGTVLLPEMSRRIAGGDEAGAFAAQNRTLALTIALAAPFFVAFLTIPDAIMRGVFRHGAFTDANALAAAAVLAAYGVGLPAVLAIRPAVASFQARGDTFAPMVISLLAVAANVALKIALWRGYGAPALALATAAGAWINVALLVGLALKRGWMKPDGMLMRVGLAAAIAAAALTLVALFARRPIEEFGAQFGVMAKLVDLALLGLAGAAIYALALGVALLALRVRLGRAKGG